MGYTRSMLASGLSIVRNGVQLDYPFIEAIRSGLPLVDEYIVVVGKSDDGTLERVRALDDERIRIVETEWSDYVQPRHCLLAQQTNIGLHLCRGRWCVYLQGNEVLHEKDLDHYRALMEEHADNAGVEALLIERLMFWADYNHWLKAYPERFKFSARIVKPHVGMHSIRDANSFAVFDKWSTRGRYPRAIDTGCDVYRYGNVLSLEKMAEKLSLAEHKENWNPDIGQEHYYTWFPRQFVARFEGEHPGVMEERASGFPSQYSLDDPRVRTRLTGKEKQRIRESKLYTRFGYPRRRFNRYQLIGNYVDKDRPVISAHPEAFH